MTQAAIIGSSDNPMISLPTYHDFKPVIVIATHNRTEITKSLLESLKNTHNNLQVVLVYTKSIERKYYESLNHTFLHLVNSPNNPLGNKWQAGVRQARVLNPDCLIILGSDDRINDEFIANAYRLLDKGYHFIGLRRYSIIHRHKKYLIDYKPIMPLGGGRVYSRQMMEAIDWHLFLAKERHLDDYGWLQVVKSGLKAICITDTEKYGMEITAIKGAWPMLNPFNPNHPNLRIIKTTDVRN